MKRFLSLAMCLVLVASFAGAVWAKDSRSTTTRDYSDVNIAVSGDNVVLTSDGNNLNFKAAVAPDTFTIYGGPGSLLGKYQTSFGPGSPKDIQSWYSNDVTDQPTQWQTSMFNSPTGTTAMWAGQTAAQQPGWVGGAGYGNGWNALLTYRAEVSNTAAATTVGLTFIFSHDSEPAFDFFDVEYDSANTTLRVFRRDGSGTGVAFPTGSEVHAIEYTGGDYSGPGNNEIIIRMAGRSDGAWSDEDGLFPTNGLAQVDNVTVTSANLLDPADGNLEDFEGSPAGFLWQPEKAPFAGNYTDIYDRITDVDPCRENETPVLGMIDHPAAYVPGDATAIGDVDTFLPKNLFPAPAATSGTQSTNWNYGIPGGWVVNYNGGISGGALDLDNEWWSPEIDWDDPTTTGDDPANVAGLRVRGTIWRHLPLINGMFYQWSVRGRDINTGIWSTWANRNFVYYGNVGDWINIDQPVSDLVPREKDAVQMQWSLRDLASLFNFPGTDSTPSPCFDNAALLKFELGGPVFATRAIDLFQDSFSQSGATAGQLGTSGERETHGVRIDMARDVNSGTFAPNEPGDSIIVDVLSVIPGVAITDSLNQIQLVYALNMNPVFETGIRTNLSATSSDATVTGGMYGWDQSVGTQAAEQSTTSTGAPIGDRYFFDLPDDHFMFPGDVLEYYIEAWDDNGSTTTLPGNISGFDDDDAATPMAYNRTYTVRALPTYTNTSGDHPDILLWNDFGRRGGEAELLSAMGQNGMQEGVQYDSYTTMGPSSLVSNGLGSAGAHGASGDQLNGYSCILYDSGDLASALISNGDNQGNDDKGDDAGTLLDWWNALGADRNIAHWADELTYMLSRAGASGTYLSTILNAVHVAKDTRPVIGGQTAPLVRPTGNVAGFSEEFLAYGGCLQLNSFDQTIPGAGAVSTHEFTDGGGGAYDAVNVASAGIYNTVTDGSGGVKNSLLFPYGFLYVNHPTSKIDPGNPSARSVLLDEVLAFFGGAHQPGAGPAVAAPSARSLNVEQNFPNPFNPSTTLAFSLGRDAKGSVRVYNVRGELVRSLAINESFVAGRNTLTWEGRDDNGMAVSSGVYLVNFQIDAYNLNQKIVMVK